MNDIVAPRAVIADDERLMREQLRARLAEAWPGLQIVAEARNGAEAVQMVAEHRPDVVFLDIRMPGTSGIEAARRIVRELGDEDAPQIVFVTAYDEYAVQAFDEGAIDYVLKPAERERLQRTAARVRQRLAARADASLDAPAALPLRQLLHRLAAHAEPAAARPAWLRWLQANVGASIQVIDVADVLFFVSDEKYTRVQTAAGEALLRKPIKELVDELDPERFWQIHRSTVVNVEAIASVVRDERGRQLVGIKGRPEKLEVSRSYAGLFKGM
jgi:DNA-binding LytR/AlgR family response regulator